MVSDDLTHWSDIFMWRQHHYQAIVSAYDSQSSSDPVSYLLLSLVISVYLFLNPNSNESHKMLLYTLLILRYEVKVSTRTRKSHFHAYIP